jgi:sulfoquinovosidase
MRTHEGNRPKENLQIDQDPVVLKHFARMTSIYVHLAPYLKMLAHEAAASGLPVQRPLFLHHEDDRATYAIQDAYLYGRDLLVAPVWQAAQASRTLYLPKGEEWTHIWSWQSYPGGLDVTVETPIGQPPVFYRTGTEFAELFAGLRSI